jgi:4-hydroxyphenylpyruvate dioxygenase
VQAADHPAVGLVVDSFHTFAVDDDDAPIAKIPGDRIFFAQLADAPLMRLDPLSWSRHFRLFPGQGGFPVTRFTRERAGERLQRSDLAGNLQRRIPRRAATPRPRSMRCARCCLLEEELAGRRLRLPARARLPCSPVCDGFEFIEFAVDAETRPASPRCSTRWACACRHASLQGRDAASAGRCQS